jgi:predicted RND superfamily exporter protein
VVNFQFHNKKATIPPFRIPSIISILFCYPFNSDCGYKFVSPWQLWLKLCRWYNRKISQIFAWLGQAVGLHPLITIAIALVLLGASASGVVFMKTENRTEKLYVPQGSESIKNLEKAGDYGFYRPSRHAEVIILQNGGNVLREACFRDALKLHNLVVAIPGYQQVCLPNIQSDPSARLSFCKREEPLWIFNYTSNLTNLLPKLNSFRPTNVELFQRVFGKVTSNNSNGEIMSAQALRMIYHIRGVGLDKEVPEKIQDWEKEFLKKMENFDTLECDSLVFTAERSIDDAISESVRSDLKLIALTYTLMIGFACFMLAKYRNPLTGHGLLAISGIQCVAFGILTGCGLSMHAQTPFVSIVGILPFMIIGVGIDDMFIIVDELDRTHPGKTTVPKRLSTVMKTIGPAITMTTMTDLVAFAVGTSSKFPSIVFFCTYAALSITFTFLFLVTVFVAFMSYDCRRMNSGRRDMVPCIKAPSPCTGAPRWDEPSPQTSNKIMEVWGRFLMKTSTKIVVMILSISLLAVGIYGTTFVNEDFHRRDLAQDGSEYIRFLDTLEEYFIPDIQVDLILEAGVNYSDQTTQTKIKDLTQIVADNKFYRPANRSWFGELQKWYESRNTTNTLLGK